MRRLGGIAAVSALLVSGALAQPTIYGSAYSGSTGPASLYRLNPATGAATLIGPIGFARVGAMDFAPNGTLYAIAQVGSGGEGGLTVDLITINTSTGAGTLVGNTGISANVFQDIAFRPSDGKLFGYNSGNLYTINTSTGVATLVGVTDDFPDGNGLAFSSAGVLYLGDNSGNATGKLFTVNPSTAAATQVATLNFPSSFGTSNPRPPGMKFDFTTGTIWAAVVSGSGPTQGNNAVWSLGTINPSNGNVTRIGPTVSGLDGIAVIASPTSVPALSFPAGLLLCALLAASAFWMLRRPVNKPVL